MTEKFRYIYIFLYILFHLQCLIGHSTNGSSLPFSESAVRMKILVFGAKENSVTTKGTFFLLPQGHPQC